MNAEIRLDDVSKFYGEVMGVNGITATLEPGVTGLVGPNGAGKSTLMSLIAGLVRPSRGRIDVLGRSAEHPRLFAGDVGYCAQYDAFPPGISARQFMAGSLRLYGYTAREAEEGATIALERVGLGDAADRRIDVYSKGMRQALKVARAIGHGPRVLLLDEPLNGLDPQARAEATALFRAFADDGAHVLISSHILHEVDAVSDRVVFLDGGYLVASGNVAEIRDEAPMDAALAADAAHGQTRPARVSIRCDRGAHVASRLFALDAATEVRLHDDGGGLSVRTSDADAFFLTLGQLVCSDGVRIEGVTPVDASVEAVYADLVSAPAPER
ncbi:MAG: ABC transporter ATP-binding protein [Gammaproteobacteria bacterium]|nr:ABC transporter ATP-binding protein [Gammaproteobacteria bacterium]